MNVVNPTEVSDATATSSRKDIKSKAVQRAEKAIGEYAHLIEGAFTETEPHLFAALGATYGAALDLLKHPDLMELFLSEVRPGPVSQNPIQPIVKQLWKGIPARDTVRRYSAALAQAKKSEVRPDKFVEWIKVETIKGAAAKWSKDARKSDSKSQAKEEAQASAKKGLDALRGIPLPDEIAGTMEPGNHLAAIRIGTDGKGELFLFPDLTPAAVDAFIIRATK